MNIKIMLNKDEEIKELSKDPEVQFKIKAAIIDGVGARAVKAVQKELANDINEAVRKAVYGRGFELKDSVKKDIETYVEKAVDHAITTKLCDIMNKEFHSIVRKKAESFVDKIDCMDITSIVEKMAKDILERKLSR